MCAYRIDPDITRAETLPGAAYTDAELFARQRLELFPRSWQYLPWQPGAEINAQPLTLLPGFLDSHLLLTKQADTWRALSNVCTHRGALLLDAPARCKTVRCPYHGRSFALDGRMLAMPAFERAEDFPGPADDLPELALAWHGPFAFVSEQPTQAFADWARPLSDAFGWVPWEAFRFAPELSRDYELAANWMLYVDNYLEGLHIPYVHPALNQALDFKAYEVHLLPAGVMQVGLAAAGEDAFELPAGHADAGRRIAAYYLWLFPNLMLNLYPWGLSLNLVEPRGLGQSRIRYLTWVRDAGRLHQGAGADTDTTEQEDHAVILRVQAGIRSRLYRRGRYSPSLEQGVHHFHRLLTQSER